MYNNRDKIIILLLLLTLVFSLFTIFISSASLPTVSARAAALYEPETDSFLYLKNADERLPMASTTKIMTALIALERLSPNEKIAVDKCAVGIEGSSIYLKPGEVLDAIDLIYAVMLQSANDAAAALAIKISGSIEEFASLMNEKARELGLKDTNFTNPHGLDNPDHYTTARDLAIIGAAALNNDRFREISSTYKREINSSETKRLVVNHNKLLRMYEGCVGVKTGYTKKSGRCLVGASTRENLTMVSVTINAPDDWNDHKTLLDYGYSLLEKKTLAEIGEFSYKIPLLSSDREYINVSNHSPLTHIFNRSDAEYTTEVRLSRYVTAPINKGDVLGTVLFFKNGTLIGEVCLCADENASVKQKKDLFHR